MTSTRLPGKVLADIDGRPALEGMLSRVRRAVRAGHIVVATTVNAADDPVARLCEELGVIVHRGDEMDVLSRYIEAATAVDADIIVRLTGDCPMIDPDIIDQALQIYLEDSFDYVSNGIQRTYPDGLDVEVFSRHSLEVAGREATHPFLREHVTPFIRGTCPQYGAGDFRIGHCKFEADLSHIRWTLDTGKDLERIRRLVKMLPDSYTWLHALSVATRYPELLGVSPPDENQLSAAIN